jgi:hypothetical protein
VAVGAVSSIGERGAAAQAELEDELARRAEDDAAAAREREAAPPAPPLTPARPPGIKLGQRCLFVGNTGTGKSEACANLFAVHSGQRVLLDTSDWYELGPEAGPAIEVEDVRAIDWRARTIRYVPARGTRDEFEDLFAAIFQRGRLFLWVDEAEDVAPSSEVRRWVRRTWKQGRKHGLTIAAATQRPAGVDRAVINQAEHAFIFPMVDPDDLRTLSVRLRMGTDELAGALQRLPVHGYLRHTLGVPNVFAMQPLPPAAIAQTRRVVIPADELDHHDHEEDPGATDTDHDQPG